MSTTGNGVDVDALGPAAPSLQGALVVSVAKDFPRAYGTYRLCIDGGDAGVGTATACPSSRWVSPRDSGDDFAIARNTATGRWELVQGGSRVLYQSEPSAATPVDAKVWQVRDDLHHTWTESQLRIAPLSDDCGRHTADSTSDAPSDAFDYGTGMREYYLPTRPPITGWGQQSSTDWGSDFGAVCASDAGDAGDAGDAVQPGYVLGDSPTPSLSESDAEELTVTTMPTEGDPEEAHQVRRAVHNLLDEPMSSRWAMCFAGVSLLTIVASTITLLVETLPKFQAQSRNDRGPWFAMETGFVAFFTLEFLARWWAADSRCAFVRDALNIVDIVAVLPYYIEQAADSNGSADGLRVLRVIRVVRVFRLLKIARYAEGIKLVMVVMSQLGDVLVLVLFVTTISVLLWSACLFYIEGASIGNFDTTQQAWHRSNIYTLDHQAEFSPFQSIYSTFWWCISTITVVGYGDVVPYAGASQAVASVTMISATFIIAIPASVFGSNFLAEYQRRSDTKISERRRAHQTRSDRIVRVLAFLMEAGPTNSLAPSEKQALLARVLWSDEFADKAIRVLVKEVEPLGMDFLKRLKGLAASRRKKPFPSIGKMGTAGLSQWDATKTRSPADLVLPSAVQPRARAPARRLSCLGEVDRLGHFASTHRMSSLRRGSEVPAGSAMPSPSDDIPFRLDPGAAQQAQPARGGGSSVAPSPVSVPHLVFLPPTPEPDGKSCAGNSNTPSELALDT